MYLCISKMKRIAVYLTLILSLTAPLTAAAQTADGVTPRAVRLSLLPKEAEGSSSLFFLDDTLWTCNDHGQLRL